MLVVNNDPRVTFDDASGVVDRGDIAVASAASKKLGQAVFAHTFVEQVALMDMGGKTTENYNNGSHTVGYQAELSVMGASFRTSNGFMRSAGQRLGLNINYKITYEYPYRGNEVYSLPLDQR